MKTPQAKWLELSDCCKTAFRFCKIVSLKALKTICNWKTIERPPDHVSSRFWRFWLVLLKVSRCFSNNCIYIIKSGVCLFVCQHFNVQLTSPPFLKLWGTQGYLWLPYDLTEVIKLIGERFEPKKYFFSKKYFMSFLPHYCHSFRITVIPSGLLSFLPY